MSAPAADDGASSGSTTLPDRQNNDSIGKAEKAEVATADQVLKDEDNPMHWSRVKKVSRFDDC